ncbi:MAG: radical SAM/SPASM family putative metalloenzyme maturase [Desulfobacteraceae bacterium]|nr:radical SAM/SPASM family putative metalloenzyme maturase [Desulfobacteraceae bacterium]
MNEYPEKLIVEPTTRCNLKCEMCVKQSGGCAIPEGDFTERQLDGLKPFFPHLKSIVFTGIGEPLLNRNLEIFISESKQDMPRSGLTGFQTNGKLMTKQRAASLIAAGADRICVSVDSTMEDQFSSVREGGALSEASAALLNLKNAAAQSGSSLKTGIQFVLMKKNMEQLPEVIKWAESKGVSFVLVSHLTAYDAPSETEQAFPQNSRGAVNLFDRYLRKAEKAGMDLRRYKEIMWKPLKSEDDAEIVIRVRDLIKEASRRGIFMDIASLLDEDRKHAERLEAIFTRSRNLAKKAGIRLTLPEIRPKNDRYCKFVEEGAMFITWDGHISPCYFLWHRFSCMRKGHVKQVSPLYFGNIMEHGAEGIWQKDNYTSFRNKVRLYDYPDCSNCNFPPCSYILDAPFEQDCHTIDVPCCDCHWNLGLLNCLSDCTGS